MIFHTKGCANEALRRDEFRGIQSCIFLSSVLNYSVKTFCFGVLTGLDNSITIRYFKAQLRKREHFESKMWHCDHNGNSSVENHFSGTVYSKLKTIAVVTPLHKNICVYVVFISVHAHKCVCGGVSAYACGIQSPNLGFFYHSLLYVLRQSLCLNL